MKFNKKKFLSFEPEFSNSAIYLWYSRCQQFSGIKVMKNKNLCAISPKLCLLGQNNTRPWGVNTIKVVAI